MKYCAQKLVSFPDHFSLHRENGLVNGLFHSRSTLQYVGRPIRLCCVSEVIHGNNGDQESWVIKAVLRRLGYTVLKPEHEKTDRNLMNSQDVFENLQSTVETVNASKIAPVTPSLKGFFSFQIFFPWQSEPPRKTNLCHSRSALYIM